MSRADTDAIVAAELQRALDKADPLRGIALLTARWGAAFVLNPDGVTRTEALGREWIARKLSDALPGERKLPTRRNLGIHAAHALPQPRAAQPRRVRRRRGGDHRAARRAPRRLRPWLARTRGSGCTPRGAVGRTRGGRPEVIRRGLRMTQTQATEGGMIALTDTGIEALVPRFGAARHADSGRTLSV